MLRNSTDVSIKKATVTQCAEPRRFVASRNWGSRRSIAMRRASPDTPTYAVNTAPQSTRHASTQMAVRNASPPSAPATALSRSAECAYTWGSGSTDSAASASRGLNRHTSSHRLRIVDENTRASRSSSTKLAVDSKLGTGGGGGRHDFAREGAAGEAAEGGDEYRGQSHTSRPRAPLLGNVQLSFLASRPSTVAPHPLPLPLRAHPPRDAEQCGAEAEVDRACDGAR